MLPNRIIDYFRRCLKLKINESVEFSQTELYEQGEEEFHIIVKRIPANDKTGNPQFRTYLYLKHKNMKIILDNIMFVTEVEEKQFIQEIAYKISLFANMCRAVYYTDCADWLDKTYLEIHKYLDYLKEN